MDTLPLVSIVIPLYNAEKYVTEAIESVLNQTYPNIELIIVNDGSTDDSLGIAKSYEREKIKIFDQPNKGASAARNYGFLQSNGEFIKFFDSDDLINPKMIEAQVNLAIKNPEAIISGKWGRFYDNDLNTFKLNPEECWQDMKPIDWICSSWKKGASMTQPGIFLIPRALIERAGLWDETLSLIDDLEYFTKTILASKSIVFCEEAILFYRSGVFGALSGKKSLDAVLSAIKALEKSEIVILANENTKRTKLIIANAWQTLLFSYYLRIALETVAIEKKIKKLGGSNIQLYSGGLGLIASKALGWKNTLRIREWLK